MDSAEIDLIIVKNAVNAILDHLIEDMRLTKIAIDKREDFYWDSPFSETHDSSKQPHLNTGRLSDDIGFLRLIQRGQNADASYNFVHIAPLLRYIGEKIKK